MNRTFGVPALAGPDRLKAGLQTIGVPRTGSWSQCAILQSWRLSMNRPTPDPSQEGSKRSFAPCQFPSWEGLVQDPDACEKAMGGFP
jgi:hypothetical protein